LAFEIPAGEKWNTLRKGLGAGASTAEKIALGCFYFACVHAAFLQPYVTVVPGERSKIFTGMVCAGALIAALLFAEKPRRYGTLAEALVTAVLCFIILVSGLLSVTSASALYRGFVVAASGAGGFWCARTLLGTDERKFAFVWFAQIVLGCLLVAALAGRIFYGQADFFVDTNLHPVASRILLLWFAPIAALIAGYGSALFSVSLFVGSYAVFYLSSLRSAMLIPVAMGGIAVLFRAVSPRTLLKILAPLGIVLIVFFYTLPAVKMDLQDEPAYYRAESYPFSWHIAKKHPWFGIGLRAPREEYLADYQIRYPYVSREQFAASVKWISTSENIFLNFMAELGIPFLIIYVGALVVLVGRLGRQCFRPSTAAIPPLALMLPICGAILHFMVLDGLMHPQISWFFHVLLGLVLMPENEGPRS
jgi:hypothetical protein